jgi:uncharacterized cupredoxin-like copper-binding protein
VPRTRSLLAFIVIGSVALAACSSHSTGSTAVKSDRTVDVTMVDSAFQPDSIKVSRGETVTFRFLNNGILPHEAVIGDDAAQQRHHDEMTMNSGKATPQTTDGMAHGSGGNSDEITVEAGKTGELTHSFERSGTLIIGCHQPDHWEAGMKVTINIT